MPRYRKIDVRIWGDEKFMALSDDGKLLFFYLLTLPNGTSLGAFRATIPGMASELNWDIPRLTKAFDELLAKHLVEHDCHAHFLGLPNFLKYNKPASPNVIKSWSGAFDLIPECELKNRLLERMADCANRCSEGFRKAFREAFPDAFAGAFLKSMANQEQDQEQDQDQEQRQKRKSRSTADCSKTIARFDPMMLPIPVSLKVNEEFMAAFGEWVQHRREIKKPLTKTQADKQLRKFEIMGTARAVAAIGHTIENGWTGIREPDFDLNNKRGPSNARPQEQRQSGRYVSQTASSDLEGLVHVPAAAPVG